MFFNRVIPVHRNICHNLRSATRPLDSYPLHFATRAETEMKTRIVARQVAAAIADGVELSRAAIGDFDARANGIAVAFLAPQAQS